MKKLLSIVMAIVLVFIMALPVHARNPMELFTLDIPESHDFTMRMNLTVDSNIDDESLQAMLAIISEINLDSRGSVEMDGLAGQMFYVMDVDIPALGMPLNFNFWFDMDFSDPEEPAMVFVVEMPAMLRLMLMGVIPELSRQFLVADLTEMLQEAMEEMGELMGSFEELMNPGEEALEEAFAELGALFEGIMSEIDDYVDFDFEFNFDTTEENGELVELEFEFSFNLTFTQDDEYVIVSFAFECVYYNFNNATPIEWPTINPRNSLDIIEWLLGLEDTGVPLFGF